MVAFANHAGNGNKVVKTNIVNDRGIHICKSMLAWQKWGNGETPETSGKKGDHLVGDCYVAFDKHYKEECKELQKQYIAEGLTEEQAAEKAKEEAPLIKEARQMLVKWEQKRPRSALALEQDEQLGVCWFRRNIQENGRKFR